MNKEKGWVSIHRSLQDHWLYADKPFNYSMAWIDLIMSCNHSDKQILFNRNLITVKRGQTLTSIRKLADRWGWGRDKVARFLKTLEAEEMIVKKSDSNRTLLTLVKYDFFQCDGVENRTVIGQQSDSDKATDKAQTIMSNNVNNDNKNKGRGKTFHPPTIEDIRKYCQEHNNGIDAEHFYNYYSARGWELTKGRKMKDWKAAVRTWECNNRKWKDGTNERINAEQRESYNDCDFFG